MRPSRALISPLLFSVLLFAFQASAQTQAKTSPIEQGAVVHLEYTVMDDKGNVIESNKGKDPLVYTQGHGQIVPGVEKAVVGMRRGETKRVTVAPEEGYGAHDPKRVMEVAKDRVPQNPQTGAWLVGKDKNGQPFRALVKEMKPKTLILDFNHPLAGKTLNFDIKVLSVTPAKTN